MNADSETMNYAFFAYVLRFTAQSTQWGYVEHDQCT